MIYRQGDVAIIPINNLPKCTKAEREGSRIVLAHGEVTGHAHAIHEPSVKSFVDQDGRLILDAPEGANVIHEEHSTITLPPGKYRVIIQREYRPEGIINVQD